MAGKVEFIIRFLQAARSLANQGMSKEAIEQFARNEFGEINELFQKQIDNLFKQKQGSPSESGIGQFFGFKNYPKKDEVFDDTIVKLPIDDTGVPFNPKDPMKQYGKPKKTDDFNLSEDDPLGDLEKIIKNKGDTGLPKKPRDKKYTGGMVDVEPNLSDIGHGSDALMARTRLVSPNSQATTSTGLNYLLAEDNDNIRVPFSKGKLADAARRKFMKTAGAGAAGLAALKTGLLGFGKEAAPVVEKVVETVSETAQGVPPYFFDLVAKIKMFGKPGTSIGPRQNTMNYKNYELMEDVSTGDLRITKQKGDPEIGYEQEVMEFRKGQRTEDGMIPDEYDEATIRPDGDGKMKDFEDGIEPDSIKEIMEEVTETITKKASGGIARMIGE